MNDSVFMTAEQAARFGSGVATGQADKALRDIIKTWKPPANGVVIRAQFLFGIIDRGLILPDGEIDVGVLVHFPDRPSPGNRCVANIYVDEHMVLDEHGFETLSRYVTSRLDHLINMGLAGAA